MSCYVPKGQEKSIKYNSPYISEKVLNEVPTLLPQAPNRFGNQSKMIAQGAGGRNGTTGPVNVRPDKVQVSQPASKNKQAAPSASGMPLPMPSKNGATTGKVNAGSVKVSQPPKNYSPTNLGFIAKNNLKFGG